MFVEINCCAPSQHIFKKYVVRPVFNIFFKKIKKGEKQKKDATANSQKCLYQPGTDIYWFHIHQLFLNKPFAFFFLTVKHSISALKCSSRCTIKLSYFMHEEIFTCPHVITNEVNEIATLSLQPQQKNTHTQKNPLVDFLLYLRLFHSVSTLQCCLYQMKENLGKLLLQISTKYPIHNRKSLSFEKKMDLKYCKAK